MNILGVIRLILVFSGDRAHEFALKVFFLHFFFFLFSLFDIISINLMLSCLLILLEDRLLVLRIWKYIVQEGESILLLSDTFFSEFFFFFFQIACVFDQIVFPFTFYRVSSL